MSASKCSCSDANRQADRCPLPEAPTRIWTAADLCTQCASVDLTTFLESSEYSKYNKLWLRTSRASNCPLCQFLLAVVSGKYPLTDSDADIELGLYVHEARYSFWQLLTTDHDTDIEQCHVIGLDTKGFEAVRRREYGDTSCPEFAISSICQGRPDNEPPAFSLRQLRPTSIDFTILRGWLGYCKNHHSETCDTFPDYPEKAPGLRVIHCKTGSIIDAPNGCEFAALSYVWGDSNAREMGEATFRGFLPDDVPRTISDAMEVAVRFNLQYLWVDQYCIDQSNARELQQQVSIMDMIYHLATVTIVAASGKDASFGLPGVGLTPRERQPTINLNGRIWLPSLPNPKTRIKASKWFSRGWTYQEGVVSRRRLIFTEEQVYFECNNIQCWETLAYDFHYLRVEDNVCSYLLFRGGFSHESVGGLDTFLQAYTRRDLSFQNDAINAIRGIFRMFSAMPSPIRHIWGIPTDHYHSVNSPWPPNKTLIRGDEFPGHFDSKFARALCWYLSKPARRREGFPSWSWAGWLGNLAPSYPWGVGYRIDKPARVKIWIQKNDGKYDRLSESVVAGMNNLDDSCSIYRPILRVQAWIGKVRIRYVAGGFSDTKTHFHDENPDPTYFVFCTDSPWIIRRMYYWPVVLSAQAAEGDELHRELLEREFDCILLANSSEFGLLVRRLGGVTERIGHVKRYWPHMCYDSEGFRSHFRYNSRRFWPHFKYKAGFSERPGQPQDLFDYIPGQERSILLR